MPVEISPPTICPAGKIEAHSRATFSYQFPFKKRITNIFVQVTSNPETQYNYTAGINLTASQGTQESWWSRVTYTIDHDSEFWTFNISLDNWSHNNGRIFQLVIEFEAI